MACTKSSQQTEDLIIKALELDIVIDKILEHLPIRIAAQAVVLSKQWRRSWLSLKSLVFDEDFWKELYDANKDDFSNRDKWSKIISSILLYHIGPVDCFELSISLEEKDCITHSQWLSFLSKNSVKKISIENYSSDLDISPYIFRCSELVYLKLNNFSPSYLPTDFGGYRNLMHLELIDINFARENSFLSLVASCRMLASLRLESCKGIEHIVIDFPSLTTLIISHRLYFEFQSIAFRNVQSLKYISMESGFVRLKGFKFIHADNLSNSCQLLSIVLDGFLFRLLVAGSIFRSLPISFNYLKKLSLTWLNLNDFGVFSYVIHMLERCPYITTLHISLTLGEKSNQRRLDVSYSQKLAHLLEIKIGSMTGSSAELKFIEHLFAISVVLEKLSFTCRSGCESQLKIARALMEFPRASPKARLVCLDPLV